MGLNFQTRSIPNSRLAFREMNNLNSQGSLALWNWFNRTINREQRKCRWRHKPARQHFGPLVLWHDGSTAQFQKLPSSCCKAREVEAIFVAVLTADRLLPRSAQAEDVVSMRSLCSAMIWRRIQNSEGTGLPIRISIQIRRYFELTLLCYNCSQAPKQLETLSFLTLAWSAWPLLVQQADRPKAQHL